MNEAKAFYDINDFSELKALSANWKTIRDEFAQLESNVMPLNRVGKPHEEVFAEISNYISKGNSYGWIQGWGKNGPNLDWLQYGLMVNDFPIPFLGHRMQETIKLLSSISGIKVAALTTLKPHSSLPCHRHPEIAEELLLQFHLTLKTSSERNYCYLNVNGIFQQHICGKPIVFDGSYDHFVLNESEEDRTILYLEFRRNRIKF